MKTILSIVTCFGFLICKSQKITPKYAPDTISMEYIGVKLDSFELKHDTIPCIMLVTDTCNCYKGQATYDLVNALRQQGFSYYINGFYVWDSYRFNEIPPSYLDADKKPLSKNIVIWMAMPTKTVN